MSSPNSLVRCTDGDGQAKAAWGTCPREAAIVPLGATLVAVTMGRAMIPDGLEAVVVDEEVLAGPKPEVEVVEELHPRLRHAASSTPRAGGARHAMKRRGTVGGTHLVTTQQRDAFPTQLRADASPGRGGSRPDP